MNRGLKLNASADLKQQVHQFWNEQSCDTQVSESAKHSRDYFEEIEEFRYFDQAFIHSFAQFTRYRGQRVLEVGFGAGTDFIQWLRAGAIASGIDLTPEALENARERIECYGLPQPEQLLTGDAEALPFAAGTFDLGYSFGVLHHSPDTEKAVSELIRVVKPGGELKMMLYNRRSIFVLNRWVRFALLKAKPWKSLRWVLWNHTESLGTKGYTRSELSQMLKRLPLENVRVETTVTSGDWLSSSAFKPLNWFYRACILITGNRFAWRPEHYTPRVNDQDSGLRRFGKREFESRCAVTYTGNALGFYHCISATKKSN